MVNFTLKELYEYLLNLQVIDGEMQISSDKKITGFSPITQTSEGSLSWMKSQRLEWGEIKATVVICERGTDVPLKTNNNIMFIPVKNPRLVFAKIVAHFGDIKKYVGISNTVQIGQNFSIGQNSYIGHYAVIGDNVKIGDNTIIHSHVSIYNNIEIGSKCIIHSGAVIGADGYGYEKDEEGNLVKMPHIGGVIIEDCVEIGSNTCIDRGTLSNTVIKFNAKIDNLCHIAHNVIIGENAAVIAHAMIGGSTAIGDCSWIAPGAKIKDGLIIGNHSLVGLGAVVVKDVPANDVVAGVPAKSIKK